MTRTGWARAPKGDGARAALSFELLPPVLVSASRYPGPMSDDLAGPSNDPISGPDPTGSAQPSAPVIPPLPAHARFGIPFNGVVPLWFDGDQIAWYRPTDGTDLADVLGLGHVETEPGPASVPEGWAERVEFGTLEEGGLRLRAEGPTGRRAINDAGTGVLVPLGEPLSVPEAMGGGFDTASFAVHIARLMLRAARDGAILVFTLRAPRDPEAHHILSIPSEVDSQRVMRFHLGTLMEMEGGAWDKADRRGGMSLLDLSLPYEALLAGAGPEAEQGLDAGLLIDLAEPVVACLLKPGFPFALGCSFVMPVKG